MSHRLSVVSFKGQRKPLTPVGIPDMQLVKCNTSVKVMCVNVCALKKVLRKVMQADSSHSELKCVLLLSVAANKPAHEHHSANLIKLGQHEVMSADRAAVVLVPLRRKNGKEIQVNCVFISY